MSPRLRKAVRDRAVAIGGDAVADVHARMRARPEYAALVEHELAQLQVARQIRELREARHWSQAELAERAHTKQPAIARIESGRTMPRFDLLQKVATAFGARLEVTFRGPGMSLRQGAAGRGRLK